MNTELEKVRKEAVLAAIENKLWKRKWNCFNTYSIQGFSEILIATLGEYPMYRNNKDVGLNLYSLTLRLRVTKTFILE